jgi:hypothetical protein
VANRAGDSERILDYGTPVPRRTGSLYRRILAPSHRKILAAILLSGGATIALLGLVPTDGRLYFLTTGAALLVSGAVIRLQSSHG